MVMSCRTRLKKSELSEINRIPECDRSPYFPFDIEQIGCGIWVEPEDVDGWARAISELLTDAEARARMGGAGRRFAELQWNYKRFCDGLCGLIHGLA